MGMLQGKFSRKLKKIAVVKTDESTINFASRSKKLGEELARRNIEKLAYKKKLQKLMKITVIENDNGADFIKATEFKQLVE